MKVLMNGLSVKKTNSFVKGEFRSSRPGGHKKNRNHAVFFEQIFR
jgi:hypothetical protein